MSDFYSDMDRNEQFIWEIYKIIPDNLWSYYQTIYTDASQIVLHCLEEMSAAWKELERYGQR